MASEPRFTVNLVVPHDVSEHGAAEVQSAASGNGWVTPAMILTLYIPIVKVPVVPGTVLVTVTFVSEVSSWTAPQLVGAPALIWVHTWLFASANTTAESPVASNVIVSNPPLAVQPVAAWAAGMAPVNPKTVSVLAKAATTRPFARLLRRPPERRLMHSPLSVVLSIFPLLFPVPAQGEPRARRGEVGPDSTVWPPSSQTLGPLPTWILPLMKTRTHHEGCFYVGQSLGLRAGLGEREAGGVERSVDPELQRECRRARVGHGVRRGAQPLWGVRQYVRG